MAQDYVAKSDNPVINGTGAKTFRRTHYCTWHTWDGSILICTIQNPDRHNTLSFVVSGAPSNIMTTDGESFNGTFSIPPNQPEENVTAIGDFKGQVVTIFNSSALNADCSVTTAP